MLKKFGSKFPDLEKQEEAMQAGDMAIRNTLQTIVPFSRDDSREAWFFRVSQRTGIRKSRVKSLFYNRQCRLWGEELARISWASQPDQSQDQEIQSALSVNADTRTRQEQIDKIKGEIKSEILEDIRALLLELRDPHSGLSVRSSGENMRDH